MKEYRDAGADHSAGTRQPIWHRGMTARNVHLAKLEYAGVNAKKPRY